MELKNIIKNSEIRVEEYKKLLSEVHKNKDIFPPDDEFVIWYKNLLRDNKNNESLWLKKLVDERTNENQSLNPPFCYPDYIK